MSDIAISVQNLSKHDTIGAGRVAKILCA